MLLLLLSAVLSCLWVSRGLQAVVWPAHPAATSYAHAVVCARARRGCRGILRFVCSPPCAATDHVIARRSWALACAPRGGRMCSGRRCTRAWMLYLSTARLFTRDLMPYFCPWHHPRTFSPSPLCHNLFFFFKKKEKRRKHTPAPASQVPEIENLTRLKFPRSCSFAYFGAFILTRQRRICW